MRLTKKLAGDRLAGVIGAALAIVLGLGLHYTRFGDALVNRSYDLFFVARPIVTPAEVRIIYLDEDSHQQMNQPENAPWDRAIHARLIDYLKADHAKAIAFDIVFSDPGRDPAADQKLAKSIEANGKVVLAADLVMSGIDRSSVRMNSIVMPDPMFATTNATIGSDELDPDDDLVIRRHLRTLPDDQLVSLSWATAELAGAEATTREKPYDRERWLNYYGPPLTVPSVSYYRIFSPEGVSAGYFSNKVVFVGAHIVTKFAGDRKDEFPTPYSYWTKEAKFAPGVEIQATTCLNLLRGDWLSRLPGEIWWLTIAGGVIGFGLAQLRPILAVGAAMGATVLITVISYYLFREERWLFAWLVVVVVQIPTALLWSVAFNSVQLYVQNKLYQQSLQMYLSPKLVKKFSSDRDLLKPGAKKQLLTVLFSDIASFTSISEGMDSDHLARSMNVYFQSAVAQCIHATDGTIVKYIGDAIFAFWNAPDDQIDHAMRACEAALRFRDQPPQYMNEQLLITRIGLHTGVANVGNFGSTARVDYTAIGENINLASRMEGLNKYLGTDVLITAETEEGIRDRLLTRFLGKFKLKGFERAVGVYELVGQVDRAEEVRPLHEAFAQALKLFQSRDIVEAEAAFRRVLEIAPKDGPAKFYLKHIAELEEHPLPEDWNGEVELKEK